MPVTKVRTGWNAGKLEFKDSTGSVLFTVDATGKALDFLFAKIDVSGGSTEASLGAKQVSSGVLTTAAILGPKIKADAVSSRHIAANAITSGLLGALSVKAAKVAANAITSTAIAADAVVAAKILDDTLSGDLPAIIPDNGTTPGIPVQYVIKTTLKAAGARSTSTLKTIAVTEKLRVIDLWVVQTSGPAATSNFTIRVRKGTNNISNAMGAKTADNSVLRPTALGSNANRKFASGSTIQIRGENASSQTIPVVYVMVRAVKSS